MAEVVRTRIAPDARLPKRRTLDERLFVRWPGAYAAMARAFSSLPPRSPLRRTLLRRTVLSDQAAWARWDLDLMLVRYAPDAHLETPGAMFTAGMGASYDGHDGLLKMAADWREAWERMELRPEEIIDAGNPVVIRCRQRVRARGSGIEFEFPITFVVWSQGGLIVRQRDFTDWDEALRVAGISDEPSFRGGNAVATQGP